MKRRVKESSHYICSRQASAIMASGPHGRRLPVSYNFVINLTRPHRIGFSVCGFLIRDCRLFFFVCDKDTSSFLRKQIFNKKVFILSLFFHFLSITLKNKHFSSRFLSIYNRVVVRFGGEGRGRRPHYAFFPFLCLSGFILFLRRALL